MALIITLSLGLIIAGVLSVAAYSKDVVRQDSVPPLVQSDVQDVNDVHSQLNRTRVKRILTPQSVDELRSMIREAKIRRQTITASGSRHAMGGQQFADQTVLLDMRSMNKVLHFDKSKGLITIEAGMEWPELLAYLTENQRNEPHDWGIFQKQTGADKLTLGGSLSANIHGRGLRMKPIIENVESFTLVDAQGNARACSRKENQELFRAAIGGYGLFGIIAHVELRLAPRTKLERVVQIVDVSDLIASFEQRIREGYVFGDFQYSTDAASEDFLKKGVFSCYRPVAESTEFPSTQKELSMEEWIRLYALGHLDKKKAFDSYATYYLSTSGQKYWSDTHQLSLYPENYHRGVDELMGAKESASEMITEIYVPRQKLVPFLETVRADFRKNKVDLFYGTIRLIEKDDESLLAWAKEPYACIIFNLHTRHDPASLDKTADDFRRLIDRALVYGGNYYLTYHRWATRQQVEAGYPRFAEFLELKKKYDPDERFQSSWYDHYKEMFKKGTPPS